MHKIVCWFPCWTGVKVRSFISGRQSFQIQIVAINAAITVENVGIARLMSRAWRTLEGHWADQGGGDAASQYRVARRELRPERACGGSGWEIVWVKSNSAVPIPDDSDVVDMALFDKVVEVPDKVSVELAELVARKFYLALFAKIATLTTRLGELRAIRKILLRRMRSSLISVFTTVSRLLPSAFWHVSHALAWYTSSV